MKNNNKKSAQQISELEQLRQRVTELKRSNSELKGTVEKLRESQEDLEAIFNDVRDGIVLLDMTGKIIKINKRIIETTGYAEKDIVGKRFKLLKMFTADSIIRMITVFAKIVAGQQSPPYEVEGYIKTGEKRIAEIHSSQLKKGGKIVGAVAVIRDITKRKQVEEELRESEERFRKVVETMKVGLATCDENGILTYVNEFSGSMIGYSPDEMVGHDPTDFYYDAEERKVQKEIFEKRRKGMRDASTHEVAWRTKDGRKVYSILSPTPIFDSEGRYKGSFAIHTDITERKQIEEALRESEERLRQIASSLREVIWLRDVKTRQVLYVNPAFEKLTGRTCESFYENRDIVINAIHPDDKQEVIKALDQRSESVPFDKEHRMIHLDGSEHWVSSRSFPVRNEAGEVYRWASIMEDITERKLAEETLRESERKWRSLYENLPGGSFIVNDHYIIEDVNDILCTLTGFRREELVGQLCNIICPKGPHECPIFDVGKERIDNDETAVKTKDGQSVPIIKSVRRISMGAKEGVIENFQDITEMVRAEEAVRQSEERFRALYEDNPSMYFTVDAEGTVLSVNQFGAEQLGYTVKELVGQSVLNVFYEGDKEAVYQHFSECLQHPQELFHWEFRKVRKDGDIIWVKEAARAVQSADGNLVVLIVCEDITERKQAEEAFRESEERYRSLVESSTDAIMMLDHDENIITCNQAFLDLFGYQKEEIIGKAIKIIHPSNESAQKFRDAHYQTLERTGSVRTEWEYVRKDGTSFPAELVISLISSAEGSIIGCISIIRDITERKRADEKLKANFDTLSKSLESTVSALASALEMRDPYTAGHQQRVTNLACAIAEEMGLGVEQIAGIRMAGLIHDIGKINIPAEILNKPGQLTEIEYSLFKNHPQVGHDVLQTVEFPWPVAQIVLQHHERFDGSGYPQGLAGEEILLEARILAVADIVEAIASHRPYRPARGIGDALEEILHNKGTLYDPEVVDVCLRVFYEKGFTFEELTKVETPLPKIH